MRLSPELLELIAEEEEWWARGSVPDPGRNLIHVLCVAVTSLWVYGLVVIVKELI